MHTKGPWRLNGKRVEYGPIIAGDGFCVAIVSRDPREAEENARLIAAAPELLEAMKNALGDLSHIPAECVPDATDRERLITAASGLRAAVAKATT